MSSQSKSENGLFCAAFFLEQDDDLQRRVLKNQNMTGHVASTTYPQETILHEAAPRHELISCEFPGLSADMHGAKFR